MIPDFSRYYGLEQQMKALVPVVQESGSLDDKTDPIAFLKLCGSSVVERTLVLLASAGVMEVVIISTYDKQTIERHLKGIEDLGLHIEYMRVSKDERTLTKAILAARNSIKGNFVVVPANLVFDGRILGHLREKKGITLCYDDDWSQHSADTSAKVVVSNKRIEQIGAQDGNGIFVGLCKLSPEVFPLLEECAYKGQTWIESLQRIADRFEVKGLNVSDIPSYVPGMRRRVRPFWCKVHSKKDLASCKRQLVASTQKGTLDFHAWYINRHIENKILYYLSELRITPNQLTVLTNIVAYLVSFLFLTGHLLAGSLLTYAVSVMDGLDGKLARIRGRLTKLGNIEHSFDFLFEQSWYVSLAWFLSSHPDRFSLTGAWGQAPLKIALGIVLFNGFATHCYMQFKEVMGISLSDCAPFDRKFRRFDGRKNIYIYYILLGVILGVPLYSLFAILIHGAVTAVVYALRACKHLKESDVK